MTFDALAAIKDATRVHPEPLSFPEGLEDASPIELAEARSKLNQVVQIARELGKLIDQQLAPQIGNGLRYGDSILRSTSRGRMRVIDEDSFWATIHHGLRQPENRVPLMRALFSANQVKLGGLPKLAAILDVPADVLRETLVAFESPTAAVDSIPIQKAPKYLQKLEDGEISGRKNSE